MSPPTHPSGRSVVLLALVALVVWFANLDYRKLIKPDEGRYAEISREMTVSGDWITPRLNGIKYFEKPPLHYWAGALAFTLFGTTEWAARLWSALTGMLGVLLAWYAGRKLFDRRSGLFAAIVLASSLMYVAVGHLNTLDMGLCLFLFLALCGFLLAQRDDATRRDQLLWMHVAWAAMAAAVLTKGLVGIVIPGAVLAIYTLIERDWRLWARLHIVTGVLLFCAITVPWFVLVQQRNPEFAWFFFVHEHLLRYTTTVHQRHEPWYYFLPLLLVGGLPWIVVMIDAAWQARRAQASSRFQPRRFLLIWCAFVLLFFSVSGSKLPPYILPLFPALALLTGWRLTQVSGQRLFKQLAIVPIVAIAALVALPFIRSSGDTPTQLIQAYKPWIAAAALLIVLAIGYALLRARRGEVGKAVVAAGLAGLGSSQLLLSGHEAIAPSMSAHAIAQEIQPFLKPGVPFYSVGVYDQTLAFYLRRTVTLVEFRDELDFGLQQEPQLAIPSAAQWMQVWREQPYALALLSKDYYLQLAADRFPMMLIAHDTRRYVIRTPE